MHQDTSSTHVVAEVAQLLDTTLREEPPAARPWIHPTDRRRLRLGGYLLAYGYLTPAQLMRVLARQRRYPAGGQPMLLGDLVVAMRYASARVVATMLTVQLIDQLGVQPQRPDRLGERLVFAGLLRPSRLATALQMQIALRGRGQTVLLGDLLVQHQLVSAHQVQRMLFAEEQVSPPGEEGAEPRFIEPRLDDYLAHIRRQMGEGRDDAGNERV